MTSAGVATYFLTCSSAHCGSYCCMQTSSRNSVSLCKMPSRYFPLLFLFSPAHFYYKTTLVRRIPQQPRGFRQKSDLLFTSLEPRRWRLLGHVLRTPEYCLVRQVLLNCVKPARETLFGDVLNLSIENASEMSKERKLWSSNRPHWVANLYQGELQ